MTEERGLTPTAYDFEASSQYDEKRFTSAPRIVFHKKEAEQLLFATKRLPAGAKVLEVGCGTGRFAKILGEAGFDVTGIDASPHMLKLAEKKCAALPKVRFRLEEGAGLSAAQSTFDFVYAIRVTNQTGSEDYALNMLREMIRVTKPGGYVLVEFVNRWRPRLRRTKTTRLTFGAIEAAIRSDRAVVERKTGIMILSLTLLEKVPERLLELASGVDAKLSSLFPRLCARNYALIRKQG